MNKFKIGDKVMIDMGIVNEKQKGGYYCGILLRNIQNIISEHNNEFTINYICRDYTYSGFKESVYNFPIECLKIIIEDTRINIHKAF